MHIKLRLIISIALALLLVTLSCQGTTKIVIPISEEPIIKAEEGKTIAIIPFTGDDYDIDALKKAYTEISKALEVKTDLVVIDRDEVEKELKSESMKELKPGTKQYGYVLGKLLRCDYVIYGELTFFSERYSEQGYAPNERYTADQPYAPELLFGPRYSMSDYDIEVKYTLRIKLTCINIKEAKEVFHEEFENSINQLYSPQELPIDLHKLYQIYSSLLYNIGDEFREKLTPHNITGKRYAFD